MNITEDFYEYVEEIEEEEGFKWDLISDFIKEEIKTHPNIKLKNIK